MQPISTRDNFVYLTCSLILLLLAIALAQQFFAASAQRLVQSTTVVTLLVAVWGVKNEQHIFRRGLIFPSAIILTSLFSYYLDNLDLNFAHLLLLLIFFIITAYKTAIQVMFTGEIDGNKILGAICLYILLGLIWSLLYTLIHLASFQAFNGMSDSKLWYQTMPDFIYFSFVTLTTLGFGDISPAMPITRFLVYFEAIVGQFYLAILVASLVGSKMSTASQKHIN